MGRTPAHQRLADMILQRPVADFITERRANGESFRSIAAALADATDGAVEVSHEAVRQWSMIAADEPQSA